MMSRKGLLICKSDDEKALKYARRPEKYGHRK